MKKKQTKQRKSTKQAEPLTHIKESENSEFHPELMTWDLDNPLVPSFSKDGLRCDLIQPVGVGRPSRVLAHLTFPPTIGPTAADAIARLISAAPELWRQLRDTVPYLDMRDPNFFADFQEAVTLLYNAADRYPFAFPSEATDEENLFRRYNDAYGGDAMKRTKSSLVKGTGEVMSVSNLPELSPFVVHAMRIPTYVNQCVDELSLLLGMAEDTDTVVSDQLGKSLQEAKDAAYELVRSYHLGSPNVRAEVTKYIKAWGDGGFVEQWGMRPAIPGLPTKTDTGDEVVVSVPGNVGDPLELSEFGSRCMKAYLDADAAICELRAVTTLLGEGYPKLNATNDAIEPMQDALSRFWHDTLGNLDLREVEPGDGGDGASEEADNAHEAQVAG